MTRKIVIITEIIAPYRIPVFNALARQDGMALHVIFLAETDKALRQWLVYTEEIRFSHEVLRSWRFRAGRLSLLVNRGLRSALDAANPQAILCGGYNYPSSWNALRWARRRNVRFVLWTESNQRDKRSGHAVIEWLKRYFVNSCDGFVVPGKASFAYLRSLGVGESCIFTAPNAVDITLFAMHAEKVKTEAVSFRARFGLPQRFILFVGRLVPEKGVFDLIQAYAKLESDLRSKVGLVFVGDGVSTEALSEQAKSIAPGTICFPEFAQREDLAGFYALAEAAVLPTHTDTWGLVVNEAMACGLPVISSSAAGCVADLIESGWNGLIVSGGEIGQLASAMDKLASNEDLRSLMGQRSRQRIAQFSPEAWAAGMAQVAFLQRGRAA